MIHELLNQLGMAGSVSGVCGADWIAAPDGLPLRSMNPTTGEALGEVVSGGRAEYERVVEEARVTFEAWRLRPAPQRGEVVRQFGSALREHKRALGLLVTLETGKILSEGLGEVQEMIDMCDFAAGLSRQLGGLTFPSERQEHRLMEQWHPLGLVGVITAFNFPMAVWAWNAAVALVCGDSVIWKPSERTPLSSVAAQRLLQRVLAANDAQGASVLLCGAGHEFGLALANDRRVPLVSATGSCAMGAQIAPIVAARFGRSLLELGGNNGAIVTPAADLDLAERAILFAAVGTAGQRCTSLRRLIVHRTCREELTARLLAAYRSVKIGDPWEESTLMGPLISEQAVVAMEKALALAKEQGGRVLCGGERLARKGNFISPALVLANAEMPIVGQETFAPILYVMEYATLDEAMAQHNRVEQGLSSAIFTRDLMEAEIFLSARGSDCGLANVNTGTSGAEIGGAFGGEKGTGGGREAGSDAWKSYMRRQTCVVNHGVRMPLAQGVCFDARPK